MRTVWVLGDQLNRRIGALGASDHGHTRVLLVESEALLGSSRHVQRLHLVIAAIRRFAAELREEGFTVDLRRAPSLAAGLRAHVEEHRPERVVATEPNSRAARELCRRLGVETMPSDQFLCHPDDFSAWAGERSSLRLEDFYRWQRTRLDYLMDGDAPTGGRWNFDQDNREPPPSDLSVFSEPPRTSLDALDEDVLASLPGAVGRRPLGLWATTRTQALARLEHFLDHELERFGRYEDAMTSRSWSLAHSMLSPYLNLGLLLPGEVCDAVEARYRAGDVPINSAEGFIRQVIGWREYVWGLYWLWPDMAKANALDNRRPLPPAFTGDAATHMRLSRRRARWARRASLGPPHPPAHGAVEPVEPHGHRTAGGDGLDERSLHRRRRVGHGPERGGHGPVGRRRADGQQAVCLGRRLHRPDE